MFVPTLKNMTVAKFAITLYHGPEAFNLETQNQSFLYLLPEEEWEHFIKEKLPPSDYPAELQDAIAAVIRPISFEIAQWENAHRNIILGRFRKKIPVCWKPDGTINQLRTADCLIDPPHVLNYETRFVLACQYWNWEDIHEFWNTLHFYVQYRIREKYTKETPNTAKHVQNVRQWFRLLRHRLRVDSCSCAVWSLQLLGGNVTMWNRAFDHLTPPYKQTILKRLFLCASIPVARICLSRMNAVEQMRMLQQYPYQVLRIYLCWPLQPMFIESAPKVIDILTKNSFLCILHILICQKILPKWRDANYVELLKKFWYESPHSCKEHVRGTDIFNILTIILDNRSFDRLLRRGVQEQYLIHGGTIPENAVRCAAISDAHTGD